MSDYFYSLDTLVRRCYPYSTAGALVILHRLANENNT